MEIGFVLRRKCPHFGSDGKCCLTRSSEEKIERMFSTCWEKHDEISFQLVMLSFGEIPAYSIKFYISDKLNIAI